MQRFIARPVFHWLSWKPGATGICPEKRGLKIVECGREALQVSSLTFRRNIDVNCGRYGQVMGEGGDTADYNVFNPAVVEYPHNSCDIELSHAGCRKGSDGAA